MKEGTIERTSERDLREEGGPLADVKGSPTWGMSSAFPSPLCRNDMCVRTTNAPEVTFRSPPFPDGGCWRNSGSLGRRRRMHGEEDLDPI